MKLARTLFFVVLLSYCFPLVGTSPASNQNRLWSVLLGIVLVFAYYAAQWVRWVRSHILAIERDLAVTNGRH